jgi:hypothetical protein
LPHEKIYTKWVEKTILSLIATKLPSQDTPESISEGNPYSDIPLKLTTTQHHALSRPSTMPYEGAFAEVW